MTDSFSTLELHDDGSVVYLASNGVRVVIEQYNGHGASVRDLTTRIWAVEQTIRAMAATDKLEAALGLREGEAP